VTDAPTAFASREPISVPFGIDRLPADPGAWQGIPRIRLRPGEVLRLNSEEFDLPQPAIGQEDVPLDVRLADHLKRLFGSWNRTAALFIDGYFAFLRGVIDENRTRIEQRLARFAGLFDPADMLYSAPLPLPRAIVPLPTEAAGAQSGGPVPVDALFWLGELAEAVLFSPSPLLPAADRRRRERLANAGIGVTALGAADLARPETFSKLLGQWGIGFWQDEVLPTAPGLPRLPEF
jgi:hypothetical protein